MDVAELAPGLWRWTTAHPDWTPEQGGPEGWQRGGRLGVLRGRWRRRAGRPARPCGRAEQGRFWRALDRDVGRAAAVHVVLTCEWHARSSADLVARYGSDVWKPADGVASLPAGVSAVDAALEARCSSGCRRTCAGGGRHAARGRRRRRSAMPRFLARRSRSRRGSGGAPRAARRLAGRARVAGARRSGGRRGGGCACTAHLPLDERAARVT